MIALWTTLAWAATVEGRVQVRGSGDPIDQALVQARDGGGATADATTGPDGRFTLELPEGAWQLTVTAEAFAPAAVDLTVPGPPPRVFLESRPPFTIVVESFKVSPHVSRHVVDAEMALETPGIYEDAVRLVQSLPGVTVQREFSPTAGDLSVRGSAPGDNRYYLDGIEVPYLYHFNQYASVFPTSQIRTLELYSSTFGAPYGDAIGAVVEAESRVDHPKAVHGSAHVNYVTAGADLSAPISSTWALAASGRRSYQDVVTPGTDQYAVWPRFHDFSLRATHTTDQRATSLFAWGAGDGYARAVGELDLLDPVEQAEAPEFDFGRAFQVAGASHQWQGEAPGRWVVAAVHDRIRGRLATLGSQDQHTWYLASRFDLRHRFTERFELAVGGELRNELLRLVVDDAGDRGVLVAEEAPALARGVSVDALAGRVRAGLYATGTVSLGALRMLPGVRVALDTRATPVLVEPRLAARWQAAGQTAVKAAAGLYHQAPETEHLLTGTGDPHLPVTRSWQAAAGVEQTIAGRWELSAEGYGKWQSDLLEQPVDGPAEVVGTGTAYGVELVTRYRLRDHFFLWGWVAVARTTVTTRAGARPADGDQPVVGGVVSSWDVPKGWNLGARYRIGSGLPYTPVTDGLYDATADRWVPVAGPENSARLPLYQKVDLHVAKTWELPRWEITLSFDVWYIPKSSAQLYPTWSYDFGQEGFVVGPTLFPLAGLRARF